MIYVNCNLNKKRTINNLFSILTCNTCNNEFSYSYTYIGNNVIHLYKINNKCINKYKKFKIMKLFLKENILDNKNTFYIYTCLLTYFYTTSGFGKSCEIWCNFHKYTIVFHASDHACYGLPC